MISGCQNTTVGPCYEMYRTIIGTAPDIVIFKTLPRVQANYTILCGTLFIADISQDLKTIFNTPNTLFAPGGENINLYEERIFQ